MDNSNFFDIILCSVFICPSGITYHQAVDQLSAIIMIMEAATFVRLLLPLCLLLVVVPDVGAQEGNDATLTVKYHVYIDYHPLIMIFYSLQILGMKWRNYTW